MDLELRSFDGCPNWEIAAESAPVGSACRLYQTEVGVEGAPSVGQLARALRR